MPDDTPPTHDKLLLLWAEFDAAHDDFLAEVRMSGEGGGDIVRPEPVPPRWPRPSVQTPSVRKERLSPERIRAEVERDLNELMRTVEDPHAAYLELVKELWEEAAAGQ